MRVGIVNHVPFSRREGGIWINRSEYLGLEPWIQHFDSVILLKPEVIGDLNVGWRKLPDHVEAFPLFRYSYGQHRAARIRWLLTASNIGNALRPVDGVYFRMPNWEGFRIWGAAKRKGLPLLLELHGDGEETILTEHYGLFGRMLRMPHAHWHHHRIISMSREADILCCWGQALAEKYGDPREKFIMSPHHLRQEQFHQRQTYRREPPYKLLFVGPLQKRKGVHFLLDALDLLNRKGVRVSLDICGSGDEKDSLVAKARSLGLSNAHFKGQVPFDDVLSAYRSADLFILPAIASDTVNRSIQEAMASSCPVVSTLVGSIPYQLEHGRLGFLVPPEDSVALAKALENALKDPALRETKARLAFQAAQRCSYEMRLTEIGGIVRKFSTSAFEKAR
jgi:glycosyltransferase involved in cell wall biosynthesis